MFGEKIEKAMADWPQTKIIENKGCIHVIGQYQQPGLHDIPNVLYGLACFFLMFGVASAVQTASDTTGLVWIGAFIMGVIAFYKFAWRPTILSLFGKKVDVQIFANKIQVKQGVGYKNYSRSTRIEFGVEEHQKGLLEEQKEYETQKRQNRKYRDAVEVVMWYGEKRIVIAEMIKKEMEKAKALVIRMQNLCMTFDRMKETIEQGQVVPVEQVTGDFGPEPDVR